MTTLLITSRISFLGKIALIVLAVLFISMKNPSQAQDLQTLFTSIEQRQTLDERRMQLGEVELQIMEEQQLEILELEEPAHEVDRPAEQLTYELKGIIRKGSDDFTIWLNDQILDAGELPSNMEIMASGEGLGLRISNSLTDQSFLVMPGQILDFATGDLVERYQYVAPVPVITDEEIEQPNDEESQNSLDIAETGNPEAEPSTDPN